MSFLTRLLLNCSLPCSYLWVWLGREALIHSTAIHSLTSRLFSRKVRQEDHIERVGRYDFFSLQALLLFSRLFLIGWNCSVIESSYFFFNQRTKMRPQHNKPRISSPVDPKTYSIFVLEMHIIFYSIAFPHSLGDCIISLFIFRF